MRGKKRVRVKTAISLGFCALISFSSCGHSNARKEYDRIRTLIRGRELVSYPIGEEEAGFLKSVRESWHTHEKECPDPIFSQVLETAEFEVSVSGVVNFYTHRLPEYSSSDAKQNLREGTRAATIGVARSKSLNGRIYSKEGLCFIKLSERVVEVFEDQGENLSRALHVKLKK